jgi:hypothetical protein
MRELFFCTDSIKSGAPHFGHALAVLLTFDPHSLHFTKAIADPQKHVDGGCKITA